MEPVSPELVLVDPALAERSRSRLAGPTDTLARVDDLVAASRLASLARRSVEIPLRSAPARLEPTERTSGVGRRRTAAFAAGLAAGTLVLALLVGVRVDLRGNPAGADTTVVEPAITPSVPRTPPGGATTKPAPAPSRSPRTPPGGATTKPVPAPSRPSSEPAPQRFAWAPAPGASAYHVELFLGSTRVFTADTKRPAVTVPARWQFGGQTHSLEPAAYRWYVWPVISGRRVAEATVQARLVIPAR